MLALILYVLAVFFLGWSAFVDTLWHFGARGGGIDILLVPLGLLCWLLATLAPGLSSFRVKRKGE